MKPNVGKIIFKDRDGNLIMDRKSEAIYFDEQTLDYILKDDARRKGVRIVSISKDTRVINCVVEYLSRKVK